MEHSVEEILEALHRLTGMCVSLYDREFRGLPLRLNGRSSSSFCSYLHQADPSSFDRCLSSDRAARCRCDRTGTADLFLCPFGLCEILVPIQSEQGIQGYLFLGKSLPSSGEGEELARAALRALPCPPSGEEASRLLCDLPRHTPEEYDAIQKTATVFAQWLAESGILYEESVCLPVLILRYLKRQYGRRITLSELCLNFHCSTVTLTESFRREYGCTIMQKLAEIRMEHAAELLRRSDLPVGEIAARCGFTDEGYFSKRFHKRYGSSPSAWRAQASSSSL